VIDPLIGEDFHIKEIDRRIERSGPPRSADTGSRRALFRTGSVFPSMKLRG
jgi:hypothetical protein